MFTVMFCFQTEIAFGSQGLFVIIVNNKLKLNDEVKQLIKTYPPPRLFQMIPYSTRGHER